MKRWWKPRRKKNWTMLLAVHILVIFYSCNFPCGFFHLSLAVVHPHSFFLLRFQSVFKYFILLRPAAICNNMRSYMYICMYSILFMHKSKFEQADVEQWRLRNHPTLSVCLVYLFSTGIIVGERYLVNDVNAWPLCLSASWMKACRPKMV